MPCPSGKFMPTVTTLTHTTESILTGITLPVSTGLHNFILRMLHAYALCLIPHLSGNDRLMMVSDIKLVLFTHISKSAFADRVSSKGFPKKNIALVLFTLDNPHHSVSVPAYLTFLKDADIRTANLLSNLYNNLSNTYLLMKRGNEAAKALRTAFDIRMEYAHLELTKSHDSLQQMMNLINMLLLAKDADNTKIVLEQYETLVLEHLSDTSLDYGICKLSGGIIDILEGKPEPAEINLLGAESIIGNAVGMDNEYMKTTYRYLNNLYARWKKPEKAIEYRDKYFNVNRIMLIQEQQL